MLEVNCPRFDEEKYALGVLCKDSHEHGNTGQSLRYFYRGRVTNCVLCARIKTKNWAKNNPERHKEATELSRIRTRDSRIQRKRERYASKKPERELKALERAKKITQERQEFEKRVISLNELCGIDTSLYTLRKLCKRKHEYLETELSLATGKDVFKGSCVECRRESRAKGSAGINYRGRKLAAICEPLSGDDLEKRLIEFNRSCAYCGIKLRRDFKDCKKPDYLNWEHMIPLAKGGTHSMSNLVPSCKSCNGSKVAKDIFEWYLNASPKPKFYCPKRAELISRILETHQISGEEQLGNLISSRC